MSKEIENIMWFGEKDRVIRKVTADEEKKLDLFREEVDSVYREGMGSNVSEIFEEGGQFFFYSYSTPEDNIQGWAPQGIHVTVIQQQTANPTGFNCGPSVWLDGDY